MSNFSKSSQAGTERLIHWADTCTLVVLHYYTVCFLLFHLGCNKLKHQCWVFRLILEIVLASPQLVCVFCSIASKTCWVENDVNSSLSFSSYNTLCMHMVSGPVMMTRLPSCVLLRLVIMRLWPTYLGLKKCRML